MSTADRPIFHLSLPVDDLAGAVEFYRSALGGEIGRQAATWTDVRIFGAQLTLHDDPAAVTTSMPRTRHFGWTLPWDQWEQLAETLVDSVGFVEAPARSYLGEPREQAKLMLSDPAGNLIELKAYRHPAQVLGALAG